MNIAEITLPPDVESYYISEFIPHWHVCANGPVPFGQLEPVHIALNGLIVPTREDVEQILLTRIEELCGMWRREFDPDEWELVHCYQKNGN